MGFTPAVITNYFRVLLKALLLISVSGTQLINLTLA